MSLYDQFLQEQGGTSQGGGLYAQYLAEQNQPSFLSRVGTAIGNYAQASADTVDTTMNALAHPITTIKNIVTSFGNSYNENVQGAVKSAAGIVEDKGIANKVADTAGLISKTANIMFSPITGAFQLAENIPGLKQVADTINIPFSAAGFAGSWATGKAIDWIPDSILPQSSKDIIKQPLQELGSLAAQVTLGGKIIEKVGDFAKRGEVITPETATKIVDEAKTETQNHPTIANPTTPLYEQFKAEIQKPAISPELQPLAQEAQTYATSKDFPLWEIDNSKSYSGGANVEALKNKIKSGAEIPPIRVFRDAGDPTKYNIYDGSNRFQAYQELGIKKFPIQEVDIHGKPITQPLHKNTLIPSPKSAEIPKTIPKELHGLATEARKYKSAEEFVKAIDENPNTVFHGTGKTFDKFDSNIPKEIGRLLGDGTYFARKSKNALAYTQEVANPNLLRTDISGIKLFDPAKDAYKVGVDGKINFKLADDIAKVANKYDITTAEKFLDTGKELQNKILKEAGYAGRTTGDNILVFDASKLKPQTKSQLTDFYNQVTKGNAPPLIGEGKQVPNTRADLLLKAAMEKKIIDAYQELPTHSQIDAKTQADLSFKFIESNPDQALKVANGEILPPSGILAENIYKTLEEKAIRNGDAKLIYDLKDSTVPVHAGQALQALDSADPNSPLKIIRDIQSARETKVIKSKPQVIDEIKTEIKKTASTRPTWEEFINQIKCGY